MWNEICDIFNVPENNNESKMEEQYDEKGLKVVDLGQRGVYRFWHIVDNMILCFFYHPSYIKPFRGVAKCSPDDEFDLEKGELIAKLRAHEKFHNERCKEIDAVHEYFFERCKEQKAALFDHEDKRNRISDRIKKLTKGETK